MKPLLWLAWSALALLAPRAVAQDAGPGETHAAVSAYARVAGTDVRLAVEIKVEKGWHIYSGPTQRDAGEEGSIVGATKLEVTGAEVTWGDWRFPKPEVEEQSFTTPPAKTYVHRRTVAIYRRGTLVAGASHDGLTVEIKGQTCTDDDGTCVPFDETLPIRTSGGEALFAAFPAELTATAAPATAGPARGTPANGATAQVDRPDESEEAGAESSLLAFLFSAVLWGLVTLLMPCTYPMIPITISFFTKQAEAQKRSTLSLSLTYGAGIVAIFVLIGLFFAPWIGRFATHPITSLVMGVAFVYFALVLFGLFNLEPPAFLMRAATSARQKGGYVGVFLMGATLVITSFTCTAPFVGTLLSTAAASGGSGRVALGMGVFGLTMAVPFVLLSLVPGKAKAFQGTAGEWMKTLKVYLGFVELAASLKFFSQADYTWQLYLFPRELFCGLCFAILFAAAAYLFGWIRMRDEIGTEDSASISPKRMIAGLVNFCLAIYFLFGMLGNRLDPILQSYIPPYSNRIAGASGDAQHVGHTIIKDDYDLALATAIREKRKLLVNFTGFN